MYVEGQIKNLLLIRDFESSPSVKIPSKLSCYEFSEVALMITLSSVDVLRLGPKRRALPNNQIDELNLETGDFLHHTASLRRHLHQRNETSPATLVETTHGSKNA
jgi:hypothetical protein